MNSRFNIITTVTYRIQCILKAVFEFMLSQMTKSKWNSCNIFDSDRIVAIKNELEEGRLNFSMLLLKTLQLSHHRRLESNLFHSIITEGKKEFLEKLCLVLK